MLASAPPLRPIRVLIADDSAYVRLVLRQGLEATPDLHVVGQARDGEELLKLIPELEPDVVTLDVAMPGLDGLATLRRIMARFPRSVVMFSTLTQQGAAETTQALIWGAVDFVPKPQAQTEIASAIEAVIAKIRLAANAHVRPEVALPPPIPHPPRARLTATLKKVVVIGASIGGPRALHTLLTQLPADLPAALLIVQHMPIHFTRALAERLNTAAALTIREAQPGDRLQTGVALVAPGGQHLILDPQGRVALTHNPPVHGVRPAVDVTMTAVAHHYGAAAVGVVLTGMGVDGAHGAALIHAAGGQVLTEAEASCVVWGMPRSVAEAGVPHQAFDIACLAREIELLVRD